MDNEKLLEEITGRGIYLETEQSGALDIKKEFDQVLRMI
jgi:hypothetical protein